MGDKSVKKLYIVLGVVLAFVGITSIIWINAYNGFVTRDNEITQKRGDVYAALSARYDKLSLMIDAIESANATVQGYLDTIMAARTAFADALANDDFESVDASITEINSTFISLVSYVEDNPSSYNTTGLYASALAEFNASTNAVMFAINQYNASVTSYNNHIKTFPNVIFVGSNAAYEPYEVANYNTTLPYFNG